MDVGNAPLRVLVTAFASVPGANHHASAVASMATGLRAQLDVVSVLAAHQAHVEVHHGARIFRVRVVGSATERRAGFCRAVRRQLDADAYDVVHVRGPHEGLVAVDAKGAQGFRLIYEVASFPDEREGPDSERLWLDAHRACLEAADLVLVPTEAAARAVGEEGHAGKTALLPPAVDVGVYDWWPAAPSQISRLLYLGSFGADRDLPTLLSAVRAFRRQHPVQVLLAGEPEPRLRRGIRRLVEAFDLQDVVQVRGEPRGDRIPMLVAACDVAVVTAAAVPRFQEWGDLPQPLLEHMACRRPVVASAVPAVAEVARDEREAHLYLPGEEDALAEALFLLASDREGASALAERAWRRVRASFSASARRRRIAEIYEMLLPGSQQMDAWDEGFEDPVTGEYEFGEAEEGEPAEPTGASIPLSGSASVRLSGEPCEGPAGTGTGSRTEELPLESTHPGSTLPVPAMDTDPHGADGLPSGDTSPGEAEQLPSEPTRVEETVARFAETEEPLRPRSVPPPPLAAARGHLREAPQDPDVTG